MEASKRCSVTYPLSGELFDVYVMKPVTDAIIQHTRTAHQYERASFLTDIWGFLPIAGGCIGGYRRIPARVPNPRVRVFLLL